MSIGEKRRTCINCERTIVIETPYCEEHVTPELREHRQKHPNYEIYFIDDRPEKEVAEALLDMLGPEEYPHLGIRLIDLLEKRYPDEYRIKYKEEIHRAQTLTATLREELRKALTTADRRATKRLHDSSEDIETILGFLVHDGFVIGRIRGIYRKYADLYERHLYPENSVYIERGDVHPFYCSMGWCKVLRRAFIRQMEARYYPEQITFTLINMGGIPSCRCSHGAFSAEGYTTEYALYIPRKQPQYKYFVLDDCEEIAEKTDIRMRFRKKRG